MWEEVQQQQQQQQSSEVQESSGLFSEFLFENVVEKREFYDLRTKENWWHLVLFCIYDFVLYLDWLIKLLSFCDDIHSRLNRQTLRHHFVYARACVCVSSDINFQTNKSVKEKKKKKFNDSLHSRKSNIMNINFKMTKDGGIFKKTKFRTFFKNKIELNLNPVRKKRSISN